ncbi:MAG: Calx-beta domain-containing protein [Microcoleaceae cyanobacterium]
MANLMGTSSPDFLEGTNEADFIEGLSENDTLLGFQGNDSLYGNEGSDSLHGGQGEDALYGGKGQDSLFGESGDDTLQGNLGDDFVLGNEGNDLINDTAGNDALYGGQGADTLFNEAGDDIVFGDRGNDILYTGLNANILTGGAGSDLFVLGLGFNGNDTDIITDFRPGFDLLGLDGELEFSDLSFVQTGNDTTIFEIETGEALAILEATQSNTLNINRFTKSITTITSTVEFTDTALVATEGRDDVLEIGIRRVGSPLNDTDVAPSVTLFLPEERFEPATIDIQFNPFESFKLISVPLSDNEEFTGDQNFSFLLGEPLGGATIGGAGELAVTVIDDDTPSEPVTPSPTEPPLPDPMIPVVEPPSISIVGVAVSPEAIEENSNQGFSYTLTRSGGSLNTAISVDFSFGGNAVLNTDYQVTGIEIVDGVGSVTFNRGSSTATVNITPIDNNVFEPDKTVELIVNESGFLYSADPSNSSAIATITNDDPPPDPPVYDFTLANFIALEGNPEPDNPDASPTTAVEVTVERSFVTNVQSEVDVILTPGTATADVDYLPTPEPVTLEFAPGETTKSTIIQLVKDEVEEVAETINLSLDNFRVMFDDGSEIEAGQAGVANPTALLTISDDDGPLTYNFSESLFTTPEGNEENITEVVTIDRTGRVSDPSSVTVELVGVDATLDTDFAPATVTVEFAAEETSTTVPITLFGNTQIDPNRTIELSLQPDEGQLVGTINPTAELIIADDDDIPTYDFSTGTYTVSEDIGTTDIITIIRSGNTSEVSSVTVDLAAGGESPAEPGDDFVPTTVTLDFAAGENSQVISLDILDDEEAEGTETVALSFTNFNPDGQAGATNPTATLVIADNDSPPIYNFAEASYSIDEGDETSTTNVVEVIRQGDITVTSRVNIVPTGFATDATSEATAGQDFESAAITLTFNPNQTSQTVPLDIVGDLLVEDDESLQLNFAEFIIVDENGSEQTGGEAGILRPNTILTLANDDVATVSITATTPEATEVSTISPEATNGVYQISRAPNTFGDLVVGLSVTEDLISAEDYQLVVGETILDASNSLTVTIPDGQASLDISLQPIDDPQAEANESLTLELVAQTNPDQQPYEIDSQATTATVTIPANDTAVTQLTDSTDDYTLLEGSFRQALENAATLATDTVSTVTFEESAASGTLTIMAELPAITQDVNIDGPGANQLTISADNQFRLFTINGGDITVEGLTLSDGLAAGTNLDAGLGTPTSGSRGGAINISSSSSTVNLIDSVIQNSTANNGGAIANSGTLNITNSTITGNNAVNGGGVVVIDGQVNITNSTIAGNTAENGGGLFNSIASLTLTNATVADNTATNDDMTGRGGGIRNIGGATSLKNTLVANNTASIEPDISTPAEFPANSGGNNLIGDATGANGFTNGEDGDIVGVLPDALLIGALADNGGTTPTIALLETSPAINAGESSFSNPFTDPGEFDQRGLTRIVDVIDIGSFEFQ